MCGTFAQMCYRFRMHGPYAIHDGYSVLLGTGANLHAYGLSPAKHDGASGREGRRAPGAGVTGPFTTSGYSVHIGSFAIQDAYSICDSASVLIGSPLPNMVAVKQYTASEQRRNVRLLKGSYQFHVRPVCSLAVPCPARWSASGHAAGRQRRKVRLQRGGY